MREPPTVLVADDVDMMRELLTLQLTRAGCRCDSVDDGATALEALHARRYDLVLMDRAMPLVDGCTATAAWRAHEQQAGLARTPIIGLGAQADDAADCLAAGMNAFLCKPLTITALNALLARELGWPG